MGCDWLAMRVIREWIKDGRELESRLRIVVESEA